MNDSGAEPTIEVGAAASYRLPPAPPPGERARAMATLMQRLFGVDEPAKIGPYELLGVIARGGMGVVYRAFDPRLARAVAVKVVRADKSDDRVVSGQRLLREARALAALRHPNVLEVFDVGVDVRGDVFLALELVEGSTLSRWQVGRAWPEICRAYAEAGAGLEAAHAVGLVHRDFKPANVLMGPLSRVRVCDFGLVVPDGSSSGGILASDGSTTAAVGDSLTHAGTVLGTPRYMSPEQYAGEPLDGRSDQFSFCVALFEAAYGEHPFDTSSRARMRASITEGPRTVPARGRVPAAVDVAIRKGLQAARADRHATMRPLLDALVGASRPRRGLRWGIAAAAGVGLGIVTLSPIDPCARGTDLGAEAFGAERQQALRDLFAADPGFGAQAWPLLRARVDGFADEWNGAAARACRDRASDSPSRAAARQRCLEESRLRLAALLRVPDHDVQPTAAALYSALARMPPPIECDGADPNAAQSRLSPEQEVAAASISRALGDAAALREARVADAAADAARAARTLATEADLPAMRAAATLELGLIAASSGDFDEAERVLAQAYFDAIESDALDAALAAATALVSVVGVKKQDEHAAQRWLGYALTLREQGVGDVRTSATLEQTTGNLLRRAGKPGEAIAHCARAVELRVAAWGSGHPDVALARSDLASALMGAGQRDAALQEGQLAVRVLVAALGEAHPDVAEARNSYAVNLLEVGRYADALQELTLARDAMVAVLPTEHPALGDVLGNIGSAYAALDDVPAAVENLQRALALREAAFGAEHPRTMAALANLALVYHRQGDLPAATAAMRRGIEGTEALLGPEHEALAPQLFNLAMALQEQGRAAEALRHYARSAAIVEQTSGDSHPHLIHPLTAIAMLATDAEQAIGHAERALGIADAPSASPAEVVEATMALATTLRRFERDATRVRELAERTVRVCAELSPKPSACVAAASLLDAPD